MKEQLLKQDLVRFLNRNYYISSHIAERLDELKDSVLFKDLQKTINYTIVLLGLQIANTDHLLNILNADNSFAGCESMISFMEGVFTTIQAQEIGTPYLCLLDYIYLSDSLMKNSAELAELTLSQLPNLKLPKLNLYDSCTLQPVKELLEANSILI